MDRCSFPGPGDKWFLTLGRRIVVFEPPKRFTGWMSKVASFMVCSVEGEESIADRDYPQAQWGCAGLQH
jgi:hypothetical protein